ncbi:(2Fe-2S) ferredoxin domain-containing protein [Peloplasma aerotolerans]|uniref:(2Fe-2S) ferredoxin domain-containing protein n=1 Tax=Peloplasma aerotolerans TaxID=3044389 RepID=A0AAW6U716_9MOLU|nr:(2Fe-2S) ferredoxin domain-containing protein [Mariniplasma sp. M4Ah]MDI6452710.1 (2Fe-2S) ferredoxin domain-containing protein [Mariniplasma sp. M4Ah]
MKSLEDLKKLRDEALKRMNMRYVKNGYRVQIGMGTCGIASGAKPVLAAFLELVEYHNLNNVTVTQVGCMGECTYEPMVEIIDEAGQAFVYCNVTTDMAKQIIEKHIQSNQPIDKYLLSTRKG